ncbi:Dihydrolipoyllysine-residue succinyltransferase component [Porphyridium purpureum]|uniref:dihydrolipoyllysine-residue succinyltransferase n=1 Tax=Porphyridium purpureum TaxID=35688 RepID=A0A5J4YN16_PORPP|nr:Dihydrolipoyllysine-residue succinyltransferase component [Porphyridium purpureum]|eukprot:POR6636..scf295_9
MCVRRANGMRLRAMAVCAPPDAKFVVEVPHMGESITEATVIEWSKKTGDVVEMDEVICQLETDKVTVDVRAPKRGLLVETLAAEGEIVYVGNQLAKMSEDMSAAPSVGESSEAGSSGNENPVFASQDSVDPESSAAPPAARTTPVAPAAAPSEKKVAVPTPVTPTLNISEAGERRVQMTRMRRRIAERLKEAQNTAAMLTTFNEVDMSALMDMRSDFKDSFVKKHGVKLGFMSAFVKACSVALMEQPEVNAIIDGTDIVYRDYVDISVAVSTPTGLVVPVLRGCENMSFAAIEKTINSLGERARDGALSIDEMQGGTFTISNGGVFGSLLSTPILNMPQSAILGMHIIQKRAVVINDKIEIRPMMYLALSYDHRLIDGREAVSFLRRIKTLIEDPRRLLLDIDV